MAEGACDQAFENWLNNFNDASSAMADASNSRATAGLTWTGTGTTCAGAIILSETIVGGLVGGVACGIGLVASASGFIGANRRTRHANAARAAAKAAWKDYLSCLGKHDSDLLDQQDSGFGGAPS